MPFLALLVLLLNGLIWLLEKTTYPGGASSSTSYTPSGQVAATVDALRRVTRFDYNDRGERIETVYPDGTSSQTFYDAEGRVTRSIDRSGRGSKTIYDSLGRVVSSYSVGTNGQAFLNPDGSIVSSKTLYDDAGRAVESIDELGHRSTSVYDASGAVIASTIFDGPNADIARTSRTLYDKAGRTVRSIDTLGRYSEPTYEDGRVVSTASYSAAGVKLNESFTSYDALGRVIATKDASGHVKRMVYDELGRLEKVIQATQGVPSPDGSGPYDLVTSFGYDELGRKVWQRDAKGRYTRFGYDERGRNIWRALPMGQIERMSYNAGGQLVSSTDFRGFITTYRYDVRGRLTLKAPDSRLGEATLSYEYPDENTRIAYRGSAATTQRYDAQRGWLDSVEGPNGKVEYAYNAAGQKTATSSPSGVTRYGYDTLGRLKTISDQPTGAASATPIASYSYDAVGNLAGVMRGNGVASSYDYDDLNRLQTLTHAKGATTLASYGYTVRGDGKRTAISESVLNADAGRVTTRSLAYEFDASGRLTNERGRDGLGVAYENAFTYDSVGNRTLTVARRAANAEATTFAHETAVTGVFNANDQLTSESSVVDRGAPQLREYDYDGNGAEKTVTVGGQTSTNGWSFEGKLTATAKSSGGGIANSFDAAGDRLSRVENVGQAAQKTTKYLVDTDVSYAQVIEERAPDSTDAAGASQLQSRDVWGQGLAPLAMWRKGTDGVVRLSYYLADGQESVRQLADASGEVTDSYHFDAFGRGLAGGSGETANPFRYTGQRLDPDGRYYLRARFYNPGNGRFLSHDPLLGSHSDPISMHRYLYAANDGVNGADPSGLITMGDLANTGRIISTLIAKYSPIVSPSLSVSSSLMGMAAFRAGFNKQYRETGSVLPEALGMTFSGGGTAFQYYKPEFNLTLYLDIHSGEIWGAVGGQATFNIAADPKAKWHADYSVDLFFNTRENGVPDPRGTLSGFGGSANMPLHTGLAVAPIMAKPFIGMAAGFGYNSVSFAGDIYGSDGLDFGDASLSFGRGAAAFDRYSDPVDAYNNYAGSFGGGHRRRKHLQNQ